MFSTTLFRNFTVSSAIFTMFAILVSVNTHATSLKVHVQDADKLNPLDNIAVCVGTTADASQFGAYRTDSNGNVTFPHLPKASVLVTVSGSQRKGIQKVVRLHNIDIALVRIVKSNRGGLGPVCNAPSSEIYYATDKHTTNYNLKITRLFLDRGHNNTNSRTVVLNPKIQGQPTHYRISEDPEFKGSEWQDYQKTPLFTLSSGEGQKQVFYQVRKNSEIEGGYVQTYSNVVSDWISLESQ
ncbi:MAG: hypothetical protein AB8D52_11045 [Gammaproteobacteria bacterium]